MNKVLGNMAAPVLGQVGPLTMHSCYSIGRAGLRRREPGIFQAEHLRDMALFSGWLIIVGKFKNEKKASSDQSSVWRKRKPARMLPLFGRFFLFPPSACRDHKGDMTSDNTYHKRS